MQTRTAEQIDGWPSQPFSGGYGGLHELAAADFSGVVSANGAWLFMLNGHAIGVDGSLDAFEGTNGTAYTAPDDSLPLLFAMLERGGEKRGQYYTERTDLSDVDTTLSQGGFTGYVELSENVLSGDYYVVYYGGNSMHAAFVGQSDRLYTGDEAAQRATDEVGLYDVVAVDLSILRLPEPADGGSDAVGVASPASNETGGESTPGGEPGDAAGGPPIDEPTAGDATNEPSEAVAGESSERPFEASDSSDLDLESTLTGGDEASDSTGSAPERTAPMDDSAAPGRPESAPEPDEGADDRDPLQSPDGDSTDEAVAASIDDIQLDDASAEAEDAERPDSSDTPTPTEEGPTPDTNDTPETTDAAGAAGTSGDPTRTDAPTTDAPAGTEEESTPPTAPAPPAESNDLTAAVDEVEESDPTVPPAGPDEDATAGASDVADTADTVESSVERSTVEEPADETAAGVEPGTVETVDEAPGDDAEESTEFDDLFTKYDDGTDDDFASAAAAAGASGANADAPGDRLADLRAENQRLVEERDELAAERDRLESRVSELEAELAASTPSDDYEQVTPETALAATDLFVRYVSKSAETLDAAHEGANNREAVRGNLDLEHHTRFDAGRTAVGDQGYEEFLPTTMEHELVTWLVADLLYEIRDTDHVEDLRPLYDALPRIDRADLHGEVDVGDDTVSFDVVCRDRLGNPLVCVDVHDSRDPATDAEMDAVLEKSGRIGEVHDEFACAFLVTSSFFEPSALELATERTASGGLFGGSKRESFVKLSRKRGYHLCLVEARDRRFHLTLPEL